MVNSPLIRPYLLGGGSFGGGTLDSHECAMCSNKHMRFVAHKRLDGDRCCMYWTSKWQFSLPTEVSAAN